MNHWAVICLVAVAAGAVGFAVYRLVEIYRRRQRWKLLMTSHTSLHIARKRIQGVNDEPDGE